MSENSEIYGEPWDQICEKLADLHKQLQAADKRLYTVEGLLMEIVKKNHV